MADLTDISADTLAILDKMLPGDIKPTLRDIATSIFLALVEDGELAGSLGVERLANIAIDLTDRISLDHGGAGFYLPRGIASRINDRDRQIFAEFNGKNKRELARKHNLSDMRIDQILNAIREKNRRMRKGAP